MKCIKFRKSDEIIIAETTLNGWNFNVPIIFNNDGCLDVDYMWNEVNSNEELSFYIDGITGNEVDYKELSDAYESTRNYFKEVLFPFIQAELDKIRIESIK